MARQVIFAAALTATVALASSAWAAVEVDPGDVAELPHFVDEIMVRWQVPGAAVAVVRGDQVVYAGGFGVLEAGSDERVTGRSLFAIGSATKAFTAVAVGSLVDEGKLDWDLPVRRYMPNFNLHDTYATLYATPRDLLAHRTGLARHDAVWYRSQASRSELFSRLRFLEPSCDLRACFSYNNLMYMAAGSLVEELTGGSWEDVVADRIFRPLRMRRSFFGQPPEADEDVAWPHQRDDDGTPVRAPFYQGWAAAPALSIYSCADDMARWLSFQLGAQTGEVVLSRATLQQTHLPQIAVPQPPTTVFPITSYGLGWYVQTYRGRLFLWHTGSIDGYYALVAFLPLDNLGVAVLTNCSDNRMPEVVSRWVVDRFLGLGEVDWNKVLMEQEQRIAAAKDAERRTAFARRDDGVAPSGDLATYEGTYRNPAYGDLQVAHGDGGLAGTFHGISGEIEHFRADHFVFKVRGEIFDESFQLSFQRAADGVVHAVASPLAKGVSPIVFTRVPAAAAAQGNPAETAAGGGRQ